MNWLKRKLVNKMIKLGKKHRYNDMKLLIKIVSFFSYWLREELSVLYETIVVANVLLNELVIIKNVNGGDISLTFDDYLNYFRYKYPDLTFSELLSLVAGLDSYELYLFITPVINYIVKKQCV